ncbi:MAG: outer membrane beta-barrel protein [Cyclobacteriaceae bacterium]
MARFCLLFFLFSFVLLSSAQDKKFAQPDLPGDLLLDIGLNYWSNDRDTLSNFASKSLGVYYTRHFRISDKFSFNPAVGLGFEKYAFKKDYHYRNVDGIIRLDTLPSNFDKNKLAVTYLDIPLELRYYPKSTIEGEGFFVGAGVIGGLKMGAHSKIKYEDAVTRGKEKLRSNFGLRDVRYGLQFRIGWKGVHFFYKHYMSPVYKGKQDLVDRDLQPTGKRYNPTVSTFGINFTGF